VIPAACSTHPHEAGEASLLGRGELLGIRPGDARRKILSSVFNCAIVEESFHKGGLPTRSRGLLLAVVYERVMLAVAKGEYKISDLDRDFRRW